MSTNSLRFVPRVEHLEKREVPATFVWGPNANDPPPDNKWTTLANWRVNGDIPQEAPGENDTVKLPSSATKTVADVPKVGSIRNAATNQTARIELAQNLTVTTAIDVAGLNVVSTAGSVNSMTVNSGGIVTVSDYFYLRKANLVLGSENQPAVTTTLTLGTLSFLRDATITNFGTMTIAGTTTESQVTPTL